MEIYDYQFSYEKENKKLIRYFREILFNDVNYACDPGVKKYYPGYGEYINNERNFFIYEIYPYNGDKQKEQHYVFLQNTIPFFFTKLAQLCTAKGKDIRINRVCLVGYQDHTHYVSEHMHNPPHNDYVGIYYPHDAEHGTEIWQNNNWEVLPNKEGIMHIIPANMLHRFYMKKGDKERIMLISNISVVHSLNVK